MKHSKINIDRTPLSDEQIAAGQDFGSVLRTFTKGPLPWYKATWFVASTATVLTACLVVAGVFVFQGSESGNEVVHTESFSIEGPCDGVNIPFVSNSVDAGDGGVLEFNGSTITIPPNAFVHCEGGDVEGDVDIRFRDFHDNVDVLLSGIPMKYDSAGTQYNFETAGMFELRGSQNGEELCIKDGKQVLVDLKSTYGDGFNNYLLDIETGDWAYLEPSPAVIEDCDPEIIDYNDALLESDELIDLDNRGSQPMMASIAQAFAQAEMAQDSTAECALGPASSSPCVIRRGQGWEVYSSNIDDDIVRRVIHECFAWSMDRKDLGLSISLIPTGRTSLECSFEIDGEEMYTAITPILLDSVRLHIAKGVRAIHARLEVRKEMKNEFAALELSKPLMPKVAAQSGYQLELKFSEKDFPELVVYDKMLFEVDETRKAFDPSKANDTWNSVEVKKGDKPGSYILVFSRTNETFSVDCYPVIEGEDVAKVEEIFNRKFKRYEAKKAELEAEAKAREEEAIRKIEAKEKRWAELIKQQTEYKKQQVRASSAVGKVTRAFTVESFGIYNCDRPFKFQPIQQLAISYVDKTGETLNHADVYLANLNADALVNHGMGHQVNFNPNERYMLWTIVEGNKLAVVDSEQFDKAKSTTSCEFEPVVLAESIRNVDHVRSMLDGYLQ